MLSARLKPIFLFAFLALLAARLISLYVIPAWQTIVTDFPNYYVSAWAVRQGHSLSELYDPVWFDQEKGQAGIERPAALFNYFPPMNALIMWPLANFSPITAKRLWTIVNVIALIAIIYLTSKAAGLKWQLTAVVAFLGGDALGNNFTYGQFYIVLTLLMLCGFLLSRRYPSIAGAATAVGAVTKIFPGFLIVYFAIRRQYRALIWSVIALAGLSVIGLIAMGWAPHQTYLAEVFGRTLRGEIQDPYNIHWNTLQAFLRRALVHDDLLNPRPILDSAWLFFFLRPVVSIGVAAATFYSIARAREEHPLLAYGALIAMVSLITPSQASYHYVLFFPAIAVLVASAKSWAGQLAPAILFAVICSNVMGAMSHLDSGPAMILAFPRAWLVASLWSVFLAALNPPAPRLSRRVVLPAAAVVAVLAVMATLENRRWIADVSDGAMRVPLESPADLELHPRFVGDSLVTSVLGADGFNDSYQVVQGATSPDGLWTAYATNDRGNWDIAIRSVRTGESRYLTSSSANDLTPSFSPDGTFVYFASDRHRGYRFTTIYRVPVDAR